MKMKFNGEFKIKLPREEVFRLLSDPQKFAPLLPTFHSLEIKDERTANLRLKVGIGKICATASTVLTLEEAVAPRIIRYVGKGKVMQGAYQVTSSFALEQVSDGTLVKWQEETVLSGKILSIAGGGLRGYAEKEINTLFTSLQQALSPEARKAREQPVIAKSWFRRLLCFLFGEKKAVSATEPTEKREPLDERLVLLPEDLKALQQKAKDRIKAILKAPRVDVVPGRKEDKRLIRGQGLYVDDYQPSRLLYMALVHSPYAHAKILSIDVTHAEAVAGVVCTLTGKEVASHTEPFLQIGPEPSANIKDYCLAVGKVLYQGEPVAAVIAETYEIAEDAAQLIEVNYERLPAVIKCEDALEDKVILHETAGTNLTWQGVYEYGDVDKAFEQAAHIVKIDHLKFHRFSGAPLETNAVVATWDRRDKIDFFGNTTMTIPLTMIALALKVRIDHIRLRTHDIGGAFGNKINSHPFMTLAALASRKAGGRSVKWVETRSEFMQSGGHCSERDYFNTEVALDEDGVITALRSRHLSDCGAYPRYEPLGCVIWAQVLPASYRLRNIRIDFSQVVTNTGPSSPNRGYSRLQHMWFMERVIDICGYELGIPADEIRLRNYIKEFPYTTPNGCIYDSGNLPMMLAKAKELIGWDQWKQKQVEARASGRLMGIGIGTTLDSGTNNFAQAKIINPLLPFSGNSQMANVKLDLDGSVTASIGSFPQGQGHETTAGEVIAQELGIDAACVNVVTGFDTERNTYTGTCGTYASQFAVTGLSAVHGAVTKLKAEMKQLVAHMLEANEDDLEFGMGTTGPEVRVIGTNKAINYWSLSNLVNSNTAMLPVGLRQLTLNATHKYVPPFQIPDLGKKYGNLTLTYALQLHIAVVEVNLDTCQTKILDYAIVDDCGKVVNHMIVKGQVDGAAGQGIGAALIENIAYDAEGNLLAGTFTDYVPITIGNMPTIKYAETETPSPFTYNGAKGMGEGGGAPLHTISAALQDALYDHGIIIGCSHNSPMALYDYIHGDQMTNVSIDNRTVNV